MKKGAEKVWFVGRFGISVKRSTESAWYVTQEKTGDKHAQLVSLFTVHRKDEPTLVSLALGPLLITFGDVLGQPGA